MTHPRVMSLKQLRNMGWARTVTNKSRIAMHREWPGLERELAHQPRCCSFLYDPLAGVLLNRPQGASRMPCRCRPRELQLSRIGAVTGGVCVAHWHNQICNGTNLIVPNEADREATSSPELDWAQ